MTIHILALNSELNLESPSKAQKQVRFDKKGDEGYETTTATANEEDYDSSSNDENDSSEPKNIESQNEIPPLVLNKETISTKNESPANIVKDLEVVLDDTKPVEGDDEYSSSSGDEKESQDKLKELESETIAQDEDQIPVEVSVEALTLIEETSPEQGDENGESRGGIDKKLKRESGLARFTKNLVTRNGSIASSSYSSDSKQAKKPKFGSIRHLFSNVAH